MRRAVVVTLTLLSALAAAGEPTPWPGALPALKLKDPLGREFTDAELKARGAVVVVTAPTHAQGGAQQAWNAALQAVKPGAQGPALVFVEDMSQSWFRAAVLAHMKNVYKPSAEQLLLLDEAGATRKAMGVPENATIAFAFAPGGRLVAVQTKEGTVARAEELVRAAR